MAVHWEHLDVLQTERVRRASDDRSSAEDAVERLRAAGFRDDEVSLVTHGARTASDGTFVPGRLEVVVTAQPERAREAERIIS
jgi:hypothetical protein